MTFMAVLYRLRSGLLKITCDVACRIHNMRPACRVNRNFYFDNRCNLPVKAVRTRFVEAPRTNGISVYAVVGPRMPPAIPTATPEQVNLSIGEHQLWKMRLTKGGDYEKHGQDKYSPLGSPYYIAPIHLGVRIKPPWSLFLWQTLNKKRICYKTDGMILDIQPVRVKGTHLFIENTIFCTARNPGFEME